MGAEQNLSDAIPSVLAKKWKSDNERHAPLEI